MKKSIKRIIIILGITMTVQHISHAQNQYPKLPNGWHVHDMKRPQPQKVESGKTNSDAPSDAIVLFEGKNLDQWEGTKDSLSKWELEKDYMEVSKGSANLQTHKAFGNMQLHIEWATPKKVEYKAQKRGNSGVFLMGLYEIQIMDAWENPAYADGMAGAVYGQNPALVNASKKPGQWQSYDIVFKAPVFKNEELVSPAYVTIFQNGVLVQNHTEVYGPTKHKKALPYVTHDEKLPLVLQNHGQPVLFRNIWVREL